jgi:predicted ATP-binding protein involved in virulence
MYIINEIELQNIRALKDQKIYFEKGVNIIIGENGTGKTTLLKVIALSLCQKYMAASIYLDSKELFKRATKKKSFSKIKFVNNIAKDEVVCEADFDNYNTIFKKKNSDHLSRQDANQEVLLSVCGVFGAQRNSSTELLQEDVSIEMAPMEFLKPLFGDPKNFLNPVFAFNLFKDYYKKYDQLQIQFEKIQSDLLAYLRMPKGARFEVVKVKHHDEKKKEDELAIITEKGNILFNDLSDGQKNILLIVFSIFYGVCLQVPAIKNTSLAGGVVLIDEIENHLHPNMERRILKFLTKCFPKLQFIVTTHSPNIIMGMDEANVISLHRKGGSLVVAKNFVPKKINETISVTELLHSDDLFDVPIFSDSVEKKITKYRKLASILPEVRTEKEVYELNELALFFYRNELTQTIELQNYKSSSND